MYCIYTLCIQKLDSIIYTYIHTYIRTYLHSILYIRNSTFSQSVHASKNFKYSTYIQYIHTHTLVYMPRSSPCVGRSAGRIRRRYHRLGDVVLLLRQRIQIVVNEPGSRHRRCVDLTQHLFEGAFHCHEEGIQHGESTTTTITTATIGGASIGSRSTQRL